MLKFDKTKLTKNLANQNILGPFLDRVFDTFDEPWTFDYEDKVHDNAWHPSGDCTLGVVALYDKATGKSEREPISNSLRKSFMVGHYWHQLIQHVIVTKLEFAEPSAIERRGIKYWGDLTPAQGDPASEWQPHWYLHVGPKPNDFGIPQDHHWVTGSGDVAPLVTPRWQGIVDIKTMSSHQFKQHKLPDWAATKYLCQINIYMDLFDEEQGMILGVNKDAPHDFKEFLYTRDQELIDAIYSKWKFVSECIDNDVVPTEEDNEQFALPIKG